MKKKLLKKLLLNKETISQLQDVEMKSINGKSHIFETCVCKTDESCSLAGNCCPTPPVEKLGLG